MIVFILGLCFVTWFTTYGITKLCTRQKYRSELWEQVAAMRSEGKTSYEFRQEVLNTIVLSDLKD